MDYQDYKKLYDKLQSAQGRQEIGADSIVAKEVTTKINDFMNKFPSLKTIPETSQTEFFDLRVKVVLQRMVTAMVEIVNELHDLVLRRNEISQKGFWRAFTSIFTHKDRRVYVGMWVVVLSFIIYFLDSSV